MGLPLLAIFFFACIPMVAALFGGGLAHFYTPKAKSMSVLQHFVAGVLIGAVSIELLPKILKEHASWSVGFGFALGVIVMSLVHELAHYLAKKDSNQMPFGLMAGGAIDFFIDGVLIGVSFLAGQMSGFIIALSLSLCAFVFAFTISSALKRKKCGNLTHCFSILILAALFPLGALLGGGVIDRLPQTLLAEAIAFGVAALLYVGVEELLVEAHETHDTVWVSSAFFLGFLIVLVL